MLFSGISENEWIGITCSVVLLFLFFLRRLRVYVHSGGLFFHSSAYQLRASKVVFIREIIRWCVGYFGLPPRCRTWPRLDLRYYKHHKVMGTYQQRAKLITVYWGSHTDLPEVVNTVIHEYQHFLDIRSGKDDRAYDKETKEVGYQDNSYERKAREVANSCQKVCLKDLERKGIIFRA